MEPCHRQHAQHVGGEPRRDLGKLFRGQLRQIDPARLAVAHGSTGDLVRLGERHALPDQPVGQVRGQREPPRRERCQPLGVERQGLDASGQGGQQQLQLVHGVEDGLLVLLQVPVVRQWQTLQRRQQTREVADQSPGLAPGQLGDVGVLLLGHDARPGRPGVVEGDEAELRRAPQHDLLAQPGQIHPELGQHVGGLGDHVAGRGPVDRVGHAAREPELTGHVRGVQAQRRTRQSGGAVRADGQPSIQVPHPVDVAEQGPAVGEQMVGQQHRLCRLQVGTSRHRHAEMGRRLLVQRADDELHPGSDLPQCVAEVHPDQGGDLVVP